jgi:hypothetical protein
MIDHAANALDASRPTLAGYPQSVGLASETYRRVPRTLFRDVAGDAHGVSFPIPCETRCRDQPVSLEL